MAEKWTIAFGRYLRSLRERRGLSLDEVESLSEAFPDPIRKAYLSRCENGHQSLALSKLVALCQIYEVPPEVLTERLQLDMELERMEAPSADGRTFSELTDEALSALHEGLSWKAYALLRDALAKAKTDPLREGYRNQSEQAVRACMNCATVALRLGRLNYALFEYRYGASSTAIHPQHSAIATERLAECFRRLGRLDDARVAADDALNLATTHKDEYALGYCFTTRALIAADDGQLKAASGYYEKAYKSYQDAGIRYECAKTLTNLAQCYFDSHRLRAARRALSESLKISAELGFKRNATTANILLGVVELAGQQERTALNRLREAAKTAESLNDRVLWFKAEFQLYKHALSVGAATEAKRLKEQLSRLRAWVPSDTSELEEFRELSA